MLSPAPIIDVHALMRGLVHELRNPLSAILTASTLLQNEQDLDEESAMLLGVLDKESRRMNRILTEFSSFVKPPKSYPEACDVAQLLREIVRELQVDGTLGHHIEVTDDLPAELMVHGDPHQIQQAFCHLFVNAAEAMPGGGKLRLHAVSDAKNVTVILDDSGGGLSEEVLARVFQPFFSTKGAATGLGLSIADGLLRASGGEIAVHNHYAGEENASETDSKPVGARIRVHLPSGI